MYLLDLDVGHCIINYNVPLSTQEVGPYSESLNGMYVPLLDKEMIFNTISPPTLQQDVSYSGTLGYTNAKMDMEESIAVATRAGPE